MTDPSNKDLIIDLGQKSMERLKEAIKKKDGVSKVEARVEAAQEKYEQGVRKYHYPILGSAKTKVKGLASLGAMALSGDKVLVKYLKPKYDKIVKGKPVCLSPVDKLTEFKNKLRNHLAESGTIILKAEFNPRTISIRNGYVNRLVDSYRLPEFASFTPGGVSHIDFVVQESAGKKKLGLDIKVALAEKEV